MIGYILAFVSILLGSGAQLLLKKGAEALTGPKTTLGGTIVRAVTNPFLLGGIALYGLSAVIWIVVLSKMKLSVAYPLVAFSYVLVAAASFFLFKETLAWSQIAALALIVVGVVLMIK